MYRISKVLNHNGVIVIDLNDQKEYVLLGKGAGFGRKIGEWMEKPETCTVYSLQETSSKGDAADLIKSVAPEYFQMANQILNAAEEHRIGGSEKGEQHQKCGFYFSGSFVSVA